MRIESHVHNPKAKYPVKNPQDIEVYLDGHRIHNPVLYADEEAGEVCYMEAMWKTGAPHIGPHGKEYTVTRNGRVEIKMRLQSMLETVSS